MTSLNDGPVCSGPDMNLPIPTTSNSIYGFRTVGSTLRVDAPRSPATSDSTGYRGEICWGSETISDITTHYIYVCVAPNTWKRSELVSWS